MDWHRRCIRFCGWMLTCAVLLRLGERGCFSPIGQALEEPSVAAFVTWLQTGRGVQLPQPTPSPQTQATQPQATEASKQPLSFSKADLEGLDVFYTTDYRPDLEELLLRPLPFTLETDEPAVLILHTHTTESYTPAPGEGYKQTSSYRTLDSRYNMLAIGDRVTELLEEAGISVIHDRQLHDYPSYNGAYNHARESTEKLLEENPGIRLILDLHRDAADTAYGQMTTQASVGGTDSAQLMLVVGTGSGGLSHPDWEENCALALKLQTVLERNDPGICRNLSLSASRYNQHLSPGALLVEVGAAGNTLQEALVAAGALARGIITLFQGA